MGRIIFVLFNWLLAVVAVSPVVANDYPADGEQLEKTRMERMWRLERDMKSICDAAERWNSPSQKFQPSKDIKDLSKEACANATRDYNKARREYYESPPPQRRVDDGAVESWQADNNKRRERVQQRQEVTPAAPAVVATPLTWADLVKAARSRLNNAKDLRRAESLGNAFVCDEHGYGSVECQKSMDKLKEREQEVAEARQALAALLEWEYKPDAWLYLKVVPLLLVAGFCFYRAAKA